MLQHLICLLWTDPGSASLSVAVVFFTDANTCLQALQEADTKGGRRFWAMLWRHVKEAALYLLGCKTIPIKLCFLLDWCHYYSLKKTYQQPALLYETRVLHIPLWSPLHSAHCQYRSLHTKSKKAEGIDTDYWGFSWKTGFCSQTGATEQRKLFHVFWHMKGFKISTPCREISLVMFCWKCANITLKLSHLLVKQMCKGIPDLASNFLLFMKTDAEG